jgi:hypothetical protein
MGYIGKDVLGILSKEKVVDTMTGNGSITTLDLTGDPKVAHNIEVYIDGITQYPNTDYTLSGTTLTFTTAPATGVNVVAVSGNDIEIINPKNGSITTTKFVDNSITNANLPTNISSSKLTGSLPALDGSSLTNISSIWLKNSSDPALDSNPSSGVGTAWVNTTSGEIFVLINATTDENVWYNVGGGTGSIGLNGFSRGGTISGYTSAGHAYNKVSTIDKYSFASATASATSWGSLTQQRYSLTGHSSSTHGYATGGFFYNNNYPHEVIDKFSFTVNNQTTDVGDLSRATRHMAGTSSTTHGYVSGGATSANIHALVVIDKVGKFSFITDGNASDVSTLSTTVYDNTGITSDNFAYSAGGYNGSTQTSHIDKMAYASENQAVNIGDMSGIRGGMEGSQSSTTHGYCTNGSNGIDKFSFSSDTDATNVGSLSDSRNQVAGQSSTTHGYASGGSSDSNVIDRFSFSTDGTASDVGDLTQGRNSPAGHQL